MTKPNAHDPKAFQNALEAWLKKGGRVLFVNDFDGTQSDIVPSAQDARMQYAALESARMFAELEQEALHKGEAADVTYRMSTGRSREGHGLGVLDLMDKTASDMCGKGIYNDQETQCIKQLFRDGLSGSFYHGMVHYSPQSSAGKISVTREGFDLADQRFKTERTCVEKARAAVVAVLADPAYAAFKADKGKYPLGIQENAGGFELNFRSVQIPASETEALQKLDQLKKAIKDALDKLLADRSVNPLVKRPGHESDVPAMKSHIEYEHQGTPNQQVMSIEIQPNGLGGKGLSLKDMTAKQKQHSQPLMVVFAGDSPMGTDQGAFRAIRMKQLGLDPSHDAALSIQVLRPGQKPLDASKHGEIVPDYVFESPKEYSHSMLRVAEALWNMKKGKPGKVVDSGTCSLPAGEKIRGLGF